MESDEQHKLIDQAKRLREYLFTMLAYTCARGEMDRLARLINMATARYQRRYNRYYQQEV